MGVPRGGQGPPPPCLHTCAPSLAESAESGQHPPPRPHWLNGPKADNVYAAVKWRPLALSWPPPPPPSPSRKAGDAHDCTCILFMIWCATAWIVFYKECNALPQLYTYMYSVYDKKIKTFSLRKLVGYRYCR